MALKDFFKKKEPRPVAKAAEAKEKKKEVEVKKPSEVRTPGVRKERKALGQAYKVLKAPHVTERATDLVSKNQYVFKVWPRANKKEVKSAVEDVYGVDVVQVRMINVPKKKRRLGKIKGFRKGYKKAIVRIKEGQKIEVLLR